MRSFTAAALAAVFLLAGCQQNAETPAQPPKDTRAPAEVANFTATPGSASVVNLSWKNPGDDDLYLVEITANPAHGSLKTAIYLAAEKGKVVSYSADGLSADTEYTFTLKTIDKSLNKSAGVSKTARTQSASVPGAPMTITLTQSPATSTNGSVTVTVTSSTSIQSAKWAAGIKTVDEVLANGTVISGGSFTVSDNGTYTVAVVDNDGRREIKTITIGNIDKTPPAEVANFTATPGSASIINLSWKNPADDDLYQVEITAHPAHGSLKYAIYLAAEKGKNMTYTAESLSADTEYTFTVKTIDKLLNKSAGVSKTARTQSASVPGAPMTITLTQSPATPTNGSVTVTVTSSTSIQSAKWISGVKTVDEVLSGGIVISGGSFTVSDNGTYTVAVVDNDGRREIKTITVSNIDKTPPSKVKNLSASYASGSQKITVTWTNPDDEDFAGTVLRYKKGAESETEVEIPKTVMQHEISPVPSDGSVYEISVAAKDTVGNESGKLTATVTASVRPSLSTVSLSRTHLAYNDADLTITAVLTGSNFGLIGNQSDPTVKAGVFDGTTLIGGLQNAALDAAHNRATVTLTAPALSGSQATAEGKTYTVKVKFCGTYESVTETFVVSKEARLTANPELSVTQIASNAVTASTKTKITIQGVNLDIAGGIKVRLYDSTGAAYGNAVPIDTTDIGRTLTTLTADIPVPSDEGFFTAKVFFGETVQTSYYTDSSYNYKRDLTHPVIQVYGSPKFTSFTIPNADISKEDSLLTATVKGVNFKAPGISASSFSVSCAISSITNGAVFTVIDDRTLKVSLTIPGSANSYTVTVSSGSESKTGTFTVKDYSAWTPGKIVLADNTLSDKDSFTLDTDNPPIAVICGKNVYGVAIGVALHKSPSRLSWAKDGTTGYYTRFTGIVCAPSGATFTGDEDGSDNWEYICSVDSEGTANAAENYPAFDWVLKYNTAYQAQLGSARPAWYMPSIAELCELYKNKEAVNESLLKIKGSASPYADGSLGTGWYWSSSLYSGGNNYAWYARFDSGTLNSDTKNYDHYVCCIAGF